MRRAATIAAATVALAAAQAPATQAATVQVPTIDGNTTGQNWYVNEKRFDGAYNPKQVFAENPFGVDGLGVTTPGGNDKANIATDQYAGRNLSDLGGLLYRAYRSSASTGPKNQLPSMQISIDANGGTLADGGFTTLVFEPVYQPVNDAFEDTWQRWDAFAGGDAIWWSTRPIPGAQTQSTYVPIKTIVAANPNAKILQLVINQGSGNGGLRSAVDGIDLKLGTTSTTFDFGQTARSLTTEQVRALGTTSDGQNWYSDKTAGAQDGTISAGPEDSLFGAQALNVKTPADGDEVDTFTDRYTGTRLTAIDALGYRTFRRRASTASPAQLPSLAIGVDKNGGTAEAGDVSYLIFEPVYQNKLFGSDKADIAKGAWQGWDAFRGGNAIWRTQDNTFESWTTQIAKFPAAATVTSFGTFQGSGNPGLDAAVDGITFGSAGNSTTFDFDTTPAPQPEATPTPTPTAGGTTTTTPGTTTPGTTPPAGGVAGTVTSSTPCKSVRRFTIRIKAAKRLKGIRKVTVRVAGKRIKVKRTSARRARATVDLRGLPAKKVAVTIRIVGKNGKVTKQTRRYQTCKKGS